MTGGLLLLATGLLAAPARAELPAEVVGATLSPQADAAAAVAPDVVPQAAPPAPALSALGLFQLRASRSSIITTNPFLDGQIIGSLGGTNGSTTDLDKRSTGTEQRATAFLTWAPPLLDGRAALTAGFEVDFAWGDQSYQTGGNKGGGFGADQVNLQTRRMYGSFVPLRGANHDLTVIAGLQFMADGAYDPHKAGPDALFRHGGGLKIWGSEAAGLAAFGRLRDGGGDLLRYRLGAYSLVENGFAEGDDVWLWLADAELHPAYAVDLGLHAWWLKDNSGGTGGSLGVGPTSQLSGLQGGPQLSFLDADGTAADVDADLLWLGADAGWNRALRQGPVGARVGGLLNLGQLYVTGQEDVAVRGWLAEAELRARWAPGEGSVARIEGLATSRDGTGRDAYTGIITGNSYGIVGAVWATHGTLLLFSDPRAINRQVAVVTDVSNRGDGLLAGIVSLGFDPIPDRLTTTGTLAHARNPQGDGLGTEAHLSISGRPLPLLELGLDGAVVTGTQVIDPTTGQLTGLPANPWIVLGQVQWLLF